MFNFSLNEIEKLVVLIPTLPLAATLVTAILGKRWLKERSHWPVLFAFAAAFLVSLQLLSVVNGKVHEAHAQGYADGGFSQTVTLWQWVVVEDAAKVDGKLRDFVVDITLRADPLTSIMLCMVTFVATLVVIYASGYMHGDPGYWRFFSYVGLFVFSMTMLVSVSNFLLLYVFWESVGVCSYLLIGFWFEKPEAAAAGKKAFLVNRIGDFGFALGVFLIFLTYGTLNFHDTEGVAGVTGVLSATSVTNPNFYVGGSIGTAIALLLFVGACGKSAQFPLHVWLPDAMEGPTPVSALIHAATMVTAGVYMVTRCTPLYAVSETAQVVVASVGMFTALLAGLIALTQNDLKRVMAYSTVSQLGYMFLGLGTGSLAGITGGMFHLFTHAFFKALLFLGAGSVMHAMHHVIDMRRFSGLRHIMPWTHKTFWFGCLALSGVFPFAGFFSKDMIIAAVHDRAHDPNLGHHGLYTILYWAALFTAFLTAFYTFRALFLTFFGPLKTPAEAHHPHESPRSMTVPLVVLAICAVSVGALLEHSFAHLLWHTPSLAYDKFAAAAAKGVEFHFDVAALSTVAAAVGIGLAAFMYLGKRSEAEQVAEFASTRRGLWLYQLSQHKFYFDELYQVFFVWPLRGLAWVSYAIDRFVIDGLVNLTGRVPQVAGALLRSLQTGMVQFYALAMVLGMLVLFGSLRFTALLKPLMETKL
ncbi:MAG: NADH-quinone oxidoreductase subunit L [Planctomycetia bacterium]|nr:NADH-quinone oxidoreductase subunit L [Planctomycetia bacterium]